MTETQHPEQITIWCETCGGKHVATYSHEGGPIYAATCTEDWLTDYYTLEAQAS